MIPTIGTVCRTKEGAQVKLVAQDRHTLTWVILTGFYQNTSYMTPLDGSHPSSMWTVVKPLLAVTFKESLYDAATR